MAAPFDPILPPRLLVFIQMTTPAIMRRTATGMVTPRIKARFNGEGAAFGLGAGVVEGDADDVDETTSIIVVKNRAVVVVVEAVVVVGRDV